MTLPKYLEVQVRKLSKAQEKMLKKQLEQQRVGARVQAGSGNLWGAKGDVRTDDGLWEHKGTQKERMIVKEGWLKKIFEESTKEGRIPYICLEFESFKVLGSVEKKIKRGHESTS